MSEAPETNPAEAITRADVCVIACADAFRDNGEILASAFGFIPAIGARLARATFSPELMLSDGEAHLVQGDWAVGAAPPRVAESWVPFRTIFDLVWHGKRHVMMIPSQIDRFGNANISAIGDFAKPKVQLLGSRGAPGNTVSHPTSYWLAKHSTRAFVEKVDMVSGVGNDHARAAGPAATRFHDLRRVVTDLAVLGYRQDGSMQLLSVHPGVSVEQVVAATGFDLGDVSNVGESRLPTAEELRLIREVFDPRSLRHKEVPVPAGASA